MLPAYLGCMSERRAAIRTELGLIDPTFLEGHDNAVLGAVEAFGMRPVLAYDLGRVLNNLEKTGLDPVAACEEWHERILGTGADDPIFVRVLQDHEYCSAYDKASGECMAAIDRVLDGADDGVGVANEPWESRRRAILQLRDSLAQVREAASALRAENERLRDTLGRVGKVILLAAELAR